MLTIASLKKGQKAIIGEMTSKDIPLKLLEMGCLPGNHVELIQIAPFKDPLYLNINDTFLSIRRETAKLIHIELIPDE
ncbi:FeoA family protein [Psychroflexus sp. MES1-P1E]|jgi:ferrous iron transport protein A|uniref:FeoA family protein n=1 Tax=Psychroflexus sp. MES1-P1E TaxID=2058320 RepID=UPI000C798482|nr:FeoA family protein [Psychroflexus sp. MES1-P1E]PKG43563.1 ferrous iron transport protein A [Psychroflexus sp. MES1-P1E]